MFTSAQTYIYADKIRFASKSENAKKRRRKPENSLLKTCPNRPRRCWQPNLIASKCRLFYLGAIASLAGGWITNARRDLKCDLIRTIISLRIDHQLNSSIRIHPTDGTSRMTRAITCHRHRKHLGFWQAKPNQIFKHG